MGTYASQRELFMLCGPPEGVPGASLEDRQSLENLAHHHTQL